MTVSSESPQVALSHLDDLWFQVAGTLCNLTCHHCFISCSPKNETFGFLSLAAVKRFLSESVDFGVKEYYFTGGEPFLNKELVAILVAALDYGPATVLTNGTVLLDRWLIELAAAERDSRYSLEFRVSIDGFSPETNDPIRGDGTFRRAMDGLKKLVQHGFLPIITAARTWAEEKDFDVIQEFTTALRQEGYERPRLKILPTLMLGAEVERTRGYRHDERVTPEMMIGFDAAKLVCEHSRIVTDSGVQVCPILIESPDTLLGQSLADADVPIRLSHGGCYTCYQYGSICSNPSGSR